MTGNERNLETMHVLWRLMMDTIKFVGMVAIKLLTQHRLPEAVSSCNSSDSWALNQMCEFKSRNGLIQTERYVIICFQVMSNREGERNNGIKKRFKPEFRITCWSLVRGRIWFHQWLLVVWGHESKGWSSWRMEIWPWNIRLFQLILSLSKCRKNMQPKQGIM